MGDNVHDSKIILRIIPSFQNYQMISVFNSHLNNTQLQWSWNNLFLLLCCIRHDSNYNFQGKVLQLQYPRHKVTDMPMNTFSCQWSLNPHGAYGRLTRSHNRSMENSLTCGLPIIRKKSFYSKMPVGARYIQCCSIHYFYGAHRSVKLKKTS